MKQVIRILDNNEEPLKPIEFTHVQDMKGWAETDVKPNNNLKIVYLGKCEVDGDMFARYEGTCIDIFKGHLNDGVY